MKNKKKLAPLVYIGWFSALFLFSISKASASPVLEGIWFNSSLGTEGVWQLSYQDTGDRISATIDFDGDFLDNSSDPEPLTLTGAKNAEGLASFNVIDHVSFGDVVGSIDRGGNILLFATDIPGADIESVTLKGEISATDFTFLHDIEYESGATTHGVILTSEIVHISSFPAFTPSFPPLEVVPLSPSNVPLPASIWLLTSSLGVLFSFGRRGRKQVV